MYMLAQFSRPLEHFVTMHDGTSVPINNTMVEEVYDEGEGVINDVFNGKLMLFIIFK